MARRNYEDDWEERADRFSQHPWRVGLKWLAAFAVFCLVVSFIFGAVSWIGSWGGEAKRVTSPQNVREQNTAIIEDYEAMDAAAANACGAVTASKGDDDPTASKDDDDPTLVEDPALAYKATYRRIRVDYNRRMANLYEAQAVRHLPLPSNLRSYPQVAPTLEVKMKEVCPHE